MLAISPALVHIDLGERKIAHADSCQLSDLTSIVLVYVILMETLNVCIATMLLFVSNREI